MLIKADARHIPLQDKTIQCCVTSPPYWGLRDYGNPDQIGLENTPEEYVASILAVMREVWRVLKNDGVLWLNLGDSYAAQRGGTCMPAETLAGGIHGKSEYDDPLRGRVRHGNFQAHRDANSIGLKHKDLVGIPWRVAFALQADGWYLRSDIIWSKPNPMPESVKDRPTKAHEYIFLLSKSEKYFFDAEAVKETAAYAGPNAPDKIKSPYGQGYTREASWKGSRFDSDRGLQVHPNIGTNRKELRSSIESRHRSLIPGGQSLQACPGIKRNIRSVWTVSTTPYSGAHFATFPREIPERCIKAGSKLGDVVLDPFCGSGTTVMVAQDLGRVGIGLDLEYQALSAERIGGSLFKKVVNSAFSGATS